MTNLFNQKWFKLVHVFEKPLYLWGVFYLLILHDIQTIMLKRHLKEPGMKIDNEKIKQKIAEQVTDDLVGKISYQWSPRFMCWFTSQ